MSRFFSRRPPVAASLLCLLLLPAATACGGDPAPPVEVAEVAPQEPTEAAADTPSGEWVTLLERGMASRSMRPERFRATSPHLRVITEMAPNSTVHSVGIVVTNLLSDASALPLASVRAEQPRLDRVTVDTTEVRLPAAGDLYFFVAEHRRIPDWTVTIQELASAGG